MAEDILGQFSNEFSPSEENGISLLSPEDRFVFCPGVSTAGAAEVRMASLSPDRKVIATSIDENGIEEVRKKVNLSGYSNQIEVRKEDITHPLPYDVAYFDFIYARLVLHYLSKQDLDNALKEFHRVIKQGKKLFIVVRATDDWEANLDGSTYNPETSMTTYPLYDTKGHKTDQARTRYFHTKNSITEHVNNAGFKVDYVKKYKEQLYHSFMRTEPTMHPSSIIELAATK